MAFRGIRRFARTRRRPRPSGTKVAARGGFEAFISPDAYETWREDPNCVGCYDGIDEEVTREESDAWLAFILNFKKVGSESARLTRSDWMEWLIPDYGDAAYDCVRRFSDGPSADPEIIAGDWVAPLGPACVVGQQYPL
ncbi:MAG: hypothetical protein HYY06_14650 [Deltaproteobacteria bacterium]|nr:hypothetical protein [Deltaproteobacteria bacterium]